MYHVIACCSFVVGITVLACLYRHIFEAFILPRIVKACCLRGRCRFMWRCIWPRWLCPGMYEIAEVNKKPKEDNVSKVFKMGREETTVINIKREKEKP
jgi:hypothetical protein